MIKIFVLLFLFSSIFRAQGEFNFSFDFAQFAYDSTSSYIEIYYSFRQNDLTPFIVDNENYKGGRINVQISDTSSAILLNRNYEVKNVIQDSLTEATSSIMGVISLILSFGEYNLKIKGSDFVDSTKNMKYSNNLKIVNFYGDKPTVSEIQLSSNIITVNVNEKSIFYKNSLEVYPNPIATYSSLKPALYYYGEVYNLKNSPNKLTISKEVFNSKGKRVYKKEKVLSNQANSIVDVGVINLSKMPTDSYRLLLSLVDSVSQYKYISEKKFFMINSEVKELPNDEIVVKGYLGSEFGVFSEQDCDEMYNQIKYIATELEIEQYEKLTTIDSKREYLFRFWQRRDTEPSTNENEMKEDFIKRIRYVEKSFGSYNKPGYKSDQGRVYLKYGEPDQIERYPNETNLKPYEIWYYHSIEGGVNFIFGDLTGFSSFELLSSTKRGEIRDDNWMRRIAN